MQKNGPEQTLQSSAQSPPPRFNRHILIVIGILLFLIVPVQAKQKQKQGQVQKQESVQDIVAKLKIQLELTDQQAQKVKVVIENYMAQEQQLKLEEAQQMKKILTGDQLYSWEDLQKQELKDKKKHSSL